MWGGSVATTPHSPTASHAITRSRGGTGRLGLQSVCPSTASAEEVVAERCRRSHRMLFPHHPVRSPDYTQLPSAQPWKPLPATLLTERQCSRCR